MKLVRVYFKLAAESAHILKSHVPETKSEYMDSILLQDAINMRLQIIGENLSQVRSADQDIYNKYANQHWNDLIGLRNSISHGYHELREEVIWEIASHLIDPLIEQFDYLANLDEEF